ncbi:unnamed protein product [Zymoseptoria tritici ST99CH_3D7]|uniref:Lariat debranching enzyme C-terminal domain-containing protein n=1 Tax=Zymoseptoria tritici (strain ST99CH_3D7) TaxID=1276538 RepID=A0A1X7S384_ZYMT9|nr:unnamed protein product [Zymoseptoria tritici ST99CH_3D7]
MSIELQETNGVRLAVEGCGHGTLHAIYASIDEACKQKGWTGIDLLIIGGDFQAVRNAYDLNCVSMPPKYRDMCDFHEYYSGQRTAPYITIFVGGNHEASNYMFELLYGGWAAPNIYYMGAANVLRLGPLRIAGMSGIWKGFDYRKHHTERLPYNESDIKSIYHVREIDMRKLLQIRTQVDVGISHDWPQGVEWKGNFKRLFQKKSFFEEDARSGRLGSVAAKYAIERLRPRYWFSAHLHCKFAAIWQHGGEAGADAKPNGESAGALKGAADMKSNDEAVKNDDEIDLDMDDDDDAAPAKANGDNTQIASNGSTTAPAIANADEIDLDLDEDDETPATAITRPASTTTNPSTATENDSTLASARAALPASFFKKLPEPEHIQHPPEITNTTTHFLALDKCLPNRDFLQLVSVPEPTSSQEQLPPSRPFKLTYDREWLSITRAFTLTEPPIFGNPDVRPAPAKSQSEYLTLITEQRTWVDANIPDSALQIPENFSVVAPVYDGGHFQDSKYQAVREYPNSQTTAFFEMLQVPNPLDIGEGDIEKRMQDGPREDPDAGRFAGRGRGGFKVRGHGGRGGNGGRGGRGRGRGRGRG